METKEKPMKVEQERKGGRKEEGRAAEEGRRGDGGSNFVELSRHKVESFSDLRFPHTVNNVYITNHFKPLLKVP